MRKKPLRKCLGCGEQKEKKDLIRVVKDKEDAFFMDKTGRMNGRGAYICNDSDCLKKAIKNKGLERSFKMAIPQDIYNRLLEEIDILEES